MLFDFLRDTNSLIDQGKIGCVESSYILSLLKKADKVLGVIFLPQPAIDSHLEELLQKRMQARSEKNFTEADIIRQALLLEGYLIEDTATGARLKKK